MSVHIASKRYCLSTSDKLVDCDSSDAAFLLVAEGSEYSQVQADKYGLPGGAKQVEAKAVAAPPQNKAIMKAKEDKEEK